MDPVTEPLQAAPTLLAWGGEWSEMGTGRTELWLPARRRSYIPGHRESGRWSSRRP